jgi:toxin ParE1/3/4
MTGFQIEPVASDRLDEIYIYTRDQWGEEQAARYIEGLFARIEAIVARDFPWRAIPAEFGVRGYFCRYEHHYIYWKMLGDGRIGIATILHERMHRMDRFADDKG